VTGAGGRAAIRQATVDDIPEIRRILTAHEDDGPVSPGGVDIIGPYVRHFVERHRSLVSELDGSVVAFGLVLDTGLARMLADQFVEPGRLGQGLGHALLTALLEDAPVRATFASSDPRALPLYVRAGMTPLWPCLYLEGTAAQVPAPDPTLTLRVATPDELTLLEAAWTGGSRPVDHAYWAGQPEADPFVVEDADGPVAFGYGRAKQATPTRALNRMLVRPGADPVPPILAGLARAARDGRVQACLLGPNPALPLLLDAGFHVVDHDQFLSSDPSLVDPARFLPNPGML
jgi:GNAT superfamily N-acetyltransferase